MAEVYPKQLPLIELTKRCNGCGLVKPASAFHRCSKVRDGLASRCKECRNLYASMGAEYCRQRRAKMTVEQRQDENRRYKAASYAKNRGKLIADSVRWGRENRENRKAAKAKWARANRVRAREYQRRRKARIRDNGSEPVDYAAILERDGYVCHICGLAVSPDSLHFDHVIPLALGGPHVESNIKIAHPFCNLSKGAKP